VHGAGAAQCRAATILAACEADEVAQRPEQRRGRIAVKIDAAAFHVRRRARYLYPMLRLLQHVHVALPGLAPFTPRQAVALAGALGAKRGSRDDASSHRGSASRMQATCLMVSTGS
jgi:hypothetical protein